MIHTICYVSNKTPSVTERELEELLANTQKNNKDKNITGTLLYLDGTFLQVLEGDKIIIASLFKKIKEDDRHKDIFVIIDRVLKKRVFQDYKSGFSIVRNESDLQNLKIYLDENKETQQISSQILNILEPFLL